MRIKVTTRNPDHDRLIEVDKHLPRMLRRIDKKSGIRFVFTEQGDRIKDPDTLKLCLPFHS